MWNYRTASPDRYKLLKEFAKKNRDNPTLAEAFLWQNIRLGVLGHKFLRQHIIGDYIVDFVCRDEGLIIEVDGAYHSEPRQEEDDKYREEWLWSKGFHIIRFTNEEVLYDIESVIQEIEHQLE